MIILGVLLALLVIAASAFIVFGSANTMTTLDVSVVNFRVEVPAVSLFAAGVVCMVLLAASAALLRAGLARSTQRRREFKKLRAAAVKSAASAPTQPTSSPARPAPRPRPSTANRPAKRPSPPSSAKTPKTASNKSTTTD